MTIIHASSGIIAASGLIVPEFTGDPYLVLDVAVSPSDAMAGIEIDADGAIEAFKQAGNQGDIGRWDGGAGTLSKVDYQFRLDTVSTQGAGLAAGSDAVDSWLAASAALDSWWCDEDALGTDQFVGTLRVRLAASPFTEYDTASLTLTASVEI
jgi:hypothetical protein